MVESVADNGIFICEQGFKDTAVCIKASSIEYRVFGLEIITDGGFQLLVNVLRTTNEAHTRHTESAFVHHLFRSLYQTGVIRQSQIVIGTKVQHFLTVHLNGCALRTFNETLLFIKSCFTNLSERITEMFLYFSVHDNRILVIITQNNRLFLTYELDFCYNCLKSRIFKRILYNKTHLFEKKVVNLQYLTLT